MTTRRTGGFPRFKRPDPAAAAAPVAVAPAARGHRVSAGACDSRAAGPGSSSRADLRILVALRSGYAVAFHWHGSQQPRFSMDRIEHPAGRWRNVAHTAGRRLAHAGLITCEGWSRPCDYGDWSSPYLLTDAGASAADGLAAGSTTT